jgi:hypothetical protein
MQKYRADISETQADGAVVWRAVLDRRTFAGKDCRLPPG